MSRRSERAKQRAPVIHPQFADGAQVEAKRGEEAAAQDGRTEETVRGCSTRVRFTPPKERTVFSSLPRCIFGNHRLDLEQL